MLRGSRPGERRGGRQRGTPNKSTVLKYAAISAASSGPNSSPLDFLLGLMWDPNLPADLRVEMAKSAAPFVHIRRKDQRLDRSKPRSEGSLPVSPARGHGAGLTLRRSSKPSYSGARKIERELNGTQAASGVDLSPLDYLLSVMNDPDAKPRLRIKAARIAAPYLHTHALPGEMPIVIEDPFGFECDPVVARAIRDDQWRGYQLLQERVAREKTADVAEPLSPEELELRAQIAERVKTLRCPAGYGPREAMSDRNRLHALFSKRISPPPYNVLTEAEDAEEAHLKARVAAYEASSEGQARSRIAALSWQRSPRNPLSAAEQSELDELRKRYPDLPVDFDDDPLARTRPALVEALAKYKRDRESRESRRR
jgi:hypothetical protein